jgi:hypothetical protein
MKKDKSMEWFTGSEEWDEMTQLKQLGIISYKISNWMQDNVKMGHLSSFAMLHIFL